MWQSIGTATQQQWGWKNLLLLTTKVTCTCISYLLGSRQHNAHGILTKQLQHRRPLIVFSLQQKFPEGYCQPVYAISSFSISVAVIFSSGQSNNKK